MRSFWKDLMIAVWLGMILPGMALNASVLKQRQSREPQLQAETIQETKERISVIQSDGTSVTMELDCYLTGVLLAEMPASFHTEALKAQSVAARTFAWKAHTTGGKHADGSVCTNSACCQAYLSKDDYISLGGTQNQYEKVSHAVLATSGIVLVYDGELIEATYFSSSGGSTESALAVWGADYPYLQAVSSPEEIQSYTVMINREAFLNLLGVTATEEMDPCIGSVTYTDGGGVEMMEICGTVYTGVELRSLLGLRSTAFQCSEEGESIKIFTRGYGHRVGLSQYGANALAESGSTWQEILQHYYSGSILAPVC